MTETAAANCAVPPATRSVKLAGANQPFAAWLAFRRSVGG